MEAGYNLAFEEGVVRQFVMGKQLFRKEFSNLMEEQESTVEYGIY